MDGSFLSLMRTMLLMAVRTYRHSVAVFSFSNPPVAGGSDPFCSRAIAAGFLEDRTSQPFEYLAPRLRWHGQGTGGVE